MKNIIKIVLSLLIITSFNSCEEGDNVIYDVLDYETGAVLRTLGVISSTLNSSIPESEWRVSLEEQDEEDGDLFAAVQVWVTLRDLTPENGITEARGLVKVVPASAFTDGPHGLPRGEVAATYAESESALGIDPSLISPGDLFVYETVLELTDGREYGASSAAGIITGGFFSSPFQYNALVVCSPEPGDYRVVMHDSYGDGWQTNTGNGGDGIQIKVVLNGEESIIEVGLCSPYGGAAGTFLGGPDCTPNDGFTGETVVTIPFGATLAVWDFPGDAYGEIGFEVYAPDGSLLYEAGFGDAAPGLLPILVCASGS